MNRLSRTSVIFSLAILGALPIARGQQQVIAPVPVASDATTTIIADLDIPDGMPLPRLLEVLKEKAPGFDYVVHHGRWEQLTLPRMHLTNLPVDSVFNMLGRLFPRSLQIRELTKSGAKDVYLVGSTGDMENDGSSPFIMVQVFSLSGAIDRQYNLEGVRGVHGPIGEARKRCMAAVLSLIENELKQADGAIERPTLSVHDETEALVVKGELNRVQEVERVLKALDAPADQNQLRALQSQNDFWQREVNRMRSELDEAKRAVTKPSDKK